MSDAAASLSPSTAPAGGPRFWRLFLRQPIAVGALVVFLALVLVALLAPVLAPHDPLQQDLRNTFAPISAQHLLGTDNLGRDVFSRLLFGAQQSIPAAALATGFAALIGIPIGLLIGYVGRWLDRVGMVATDVILTFPGVILAIALVAVFGNSLVNAMLALGLVFSPSFVRLARAETLRVRHDNFIVAARLLDYPTARILGRHVLPNVVPPLIVQAFLSFSFALLAQSGLAFLGIGVRPPAPAWGSMLADSTTFMAAHPLLVLPPGLAIALTALAASLVGDGIRDSLGTGVRARPKRVPRVAPVVVSGEAPATGATLEVRDLTVGYRTDDGWVDILSSVSLNVHPGQTLGLVGESGSGKSITALAVMGLLPEPLGVRAGSIRLDGTELLDLREKQLRTLRGRVVSMIFQDPLSALNPSLTVGHQLVETIRLYRPMSVAAARKEAIALLERVEITRPADRLQAYPHEFSGGMAQRVMIAMAIAGEPRLIVADEPTTALDVTVQVEILDLLRHLQRQTGVGVLFITHDMGVVADICDEAAVMLKGEVVEISPVDELFAGASHAYTRELLESARGAE